MGVPHSVTEDDKMDVNDGRIYKGTTVWANI